MVNVYISSSIKFNSQTLADLRIFGVLGLFSHSLLFSIRNNTHHYDISLAIWTRSETSESKGSVLTLVARGEHLFSQAGDCHPAVCTFTHAQVPYPSGTKVLTFIEGPNRQYDLLSETFNHSLSKSRPPCPHSLLPSYAHSHCFSLPLMLKLEFQRKR